MATDEHDAENVVPRRFQAKVELDVETGLAAAVARDRSR
jgi:hypothetical protein